jgi:hypothetical protein
MDTDILEKIESYIRELKWNSDDKIEVQIGGCAASGLSPSDQANSKWHRPYGVVGYQDDAFIVIKNRSRNQVIPSSSPQN